MDLRIGINADSSTIDGRVAVLDSLLERFHAAGFSHAEIPVHGVDCIAGGNLHKERLKDVLAVLRKHSLSYTVHGPDALNLADPARPELHAAALRAAVDFTAEIGAELLVYHGSYLPAGKDAAPRPRVEKKVFDPAEVQQRWTEEIDRLGGIAARAEARGVKVAVENIFRQSAGETTYRIDPRELACVVEAVASPALGICFDFGHAYISAGEEGFSLVEAFAAVKSRLLHVHLHDNFGKPPAEKARTIDALPMGDGDLHLPIGWGTLPYNELFPLLVPGYRGVYMFELQPRFADRYEEALRRLRSEVERLMEN